MSQLVACRHPAGLILAADRRMVVQRQGRQEVHSVRKLFPLGPAAAVATSGAAVGIMVSRTLSRLLRRRREAVAFPDLEAYVLSVFQQEYDGFVRQGERWFADNPEAHRRSYLLLGGKSDSGGFAFRFFASEEHHQPYSLLPTGDVLTAPRRLGLETRLTRALASGAGTDALLDLVVQGLTRIADKVEEVAGPFDLAQVTASGVAVREFP